MNSTNNNPPTISSNYVQIFLLNLVVSAFSSSIPSSSSTFSTSIPFSSTPSSSSPYSTCTEEDFAEISRQSFLSFVENIPQTHKLMANPLDIYEKEDAEQIFCSELTSYFRQEIIEDLFSRFPCLSSAAQRDSVMGFKAILLLDDKNLLKDKIAASAAACPDLGKQIDQLKLDLSGHAVIFAAEELAKLDGEDGCDEKELVAYAEVAENCRIDAELVLRINLLNAQLSTAFGSSKAITPDHIGKMFCQYNKTVVGDCQKVLDQCFEDKEEVTEYVGEAVKSNTDHQFIGEIIFSGETSEILYGSDLKKMVQECNFETKNTY